MRICGDRGDPLRLCRSHQLTSEKILRLQEDTWGIMDAVRRDQQGDIVSNIPHMRLFMELKRQFPLLKDADITECIQRFGLDRFRCEDELNRKIQDQHKGYYSPWNQSRAGSRGSPASRDSPLSPETPSHSSPIPNGSTPSTPVVSSPHISHHPDFAISSSSSDLEEEEEEEEVVEIDQKNNFENTLAISSPSVLHAGQMNSVYSCAADTKLSTTPSYYQPTLLRKCAVPLTNINNNGFCVASNGYNSQNAVPNSAPVIPSAQELPFLIQPANNRRRSVESAVERRKRILASRNLFEASLYESSNHFQNESLHESNQENHRKTTSVSSPSSPTNTTTSPPSIASPPVTTQTSYSSPHMNDQCPQQQSPAAIQEQLSRKNKLREELHRRLEEKGKLEEEVKNLSEELESKERNQRHDVETSKKKIALIQQENSQLQFICDEMEREILESGESPKSDQEGRILSSRQPTTPNESTSPFLDTTLRPPQSLVRASSTSSLSSGVATPTTPIIPSRRAPSPPLSTPSAVHGSTSVGHGAVQNSNQGNTQQNNVAATEDGGKGWSCSKCTFINSPFLNECEICGFPHFSIGTPPLLSHQPPSTAPTPGGPCYCHHRHYNLNHEHHSTGELQDIHIQVRHQNLHSPSKLPLPPPNSKRKLSQKLRSPCGTFENPKYRD